VRSKSYDVIVIGGGVVGCAILRELSSLNLKVALLEKFDDVSCGASKANSGIIHSGYDCKPNTLKAKFCVEGNKMAQGLCHDLEVPFKNTGSLVVGRSADLTEIKRLYNQGLENGVSGLEIIGSAKLRELEPNLKTDYIHALWAKTASIISPYMKTIALAESAMQNGAKVYLNSEVVKIDNLGGLEKAQGGFKFRLHTASNQTFYTKCIINAAGAGASIINELAGAEALEQKYRKGDYFVSDLSEKGLVNTIIFPTPSPLGKGVLVLPTVDGNVLFGPTAIDIDDGFDTSVSRDGLDLIVASTSQMVNNINWDNMIRVYAGVRFISGDDFVIEVSDKVGGFITVGGICSPGLTAAYPIAQYVKGLYKTHINKKATDKANFNPIRKRAKYFTEMNEIELRDRIKANPSYAKIVCRCETISEGEIMDAVNSPLKPTSTDAIKRRVRAGMGSCQGAFCQAKIMALIAKKRKVKISKVGKK